MKILRLNDSIIKLYDLNDIYYIKVTPELEYVLYPHDIYILNSSYCIYIKYPGLSIELYDVLDIIRIEKEISIYKDNNYVEIFKLNNKRVLKL